MRCRNCGHMNPEQNRFCGMCGGALAGQPSSKPTDKEQPVAEQVTRTAEVRRVPENGEERVVEPERNVDPWWEDEHADLEQPVARVGSGEVKPATKSTPFQTAKVSSVAPEARRRGDKWWVDEQPGDRVQQLREPKPDAPVVEEAPKKNDKWWVDDGPTTVGGPSFLGLSSGSTESGGGYSYLFQEEEERSHAGRWVALLILLIAAAVLYFKWQPIRDFVLTTAISHSKPKTPAEQQQANSDPAGNATSGAGTTTLASSDTPSQPTITTETKPEQPKQAASRPPDGDKVGAATTDDNSSNPKTDKSEQASKPATPPKSAPEPNRAATSEGKQSAKSQPKQQAQEADTGDDSAAADDQSTAASRRGREAQVNPGSELVTTGEKYLYGRGVTRSCNQAVSYFNAAAARQNPQAYSHLGALYATGECVPMDRATAYAYFRRAYSKEPTNHYFEQNLTMLWREMSPDERQRATAGKTSSF